MDDANHLINNADQTPSPKQNAAKEKRAFSVWKVLLPVAIGLGVVGLMLYHDAKNENLAAVWESIHFTPRVIFCLILGVVCMCGRDIGLIWRFRALTDRKLTIGQAWKVDMLCEFTNCVTPSAVGGSSLGMIFLNTQGIEIGRATTLMLTTLFMDELFFVVSCPIVILCSYGQDIFASGGADFSHGIKYTFWVVYALIACWTFLLFAGIIWKPIWIRKSLDHISSWHWLRKWSKSISSLGDNMVETSKELRTKPIRFWIEVFIGTALAWTCRYFVVNVLFWGFLPSSDPYQWVILARQFVIWVVLMVSPTPGGAGLSEWLFSSYYGDIVTTAGMALILAVFWRLITYYLYLFVGALIVPGWISNAFSRRDVRNGKQVTHSAMSGVSDYENPSPNKEKTIIK